MRSSSITLSSWLRGFETKSDTLIRYFEIHRGFGIQQTFKTDFMIPTGFVFK
jgi:hypothetical protein